MKKDRVGTIIVVSAVLLTLPVAVFLTTREESVGDIRNRAAGEDTTITLYPSDQNYSIDVLGTNLGTYPVTPRMDPYMDAESEARAEYIRILKDFGMRYLRFPNGCHIARFDWAEDQYAIDSLDAVLEVADEAGVEVVFEMSVMGLIDPDGSDQYTNPCGNTVEVRFPLGSLANPTPFGIRNFVKKYTLDRKNAGEPYIKHYELGNEEWGYMNHTTGRWLTPAEYVTAAATVSQAIRSVVASDSQLANEVKIYGVSSPVNKDGYVGAPVEYDGTKIPWGAVEYKNASANFDLITLHDYWHDKWAGGDAAPEGDSLFALEHHFGGDLEMYSEVMNSVSKFKRPAVTEWNLYCWKEGVTQRRHRNTQRFEHTLFMLGNLLNQFENRVPISLQHELHITNSTLEQTSVDKDGCNLIYAKSTDPWEFVAGAPGKAYEVINQHFGNTHVKTEIDSPKISYKTTDGYESIIGGSSKGDGKMYSILINRKTFSVSNPDDPQNSQSAKVTISDYEGDVAYKLYTLQAPAYDSTADKVVFKKAEEKTVDNGFSIPIRSQSAVILEMTLEGASGGGMADINGDGTINMSDYSLFVSDYLDWRRNEIMHTRSDLDGNGSLNLADYSIFVEKYLEARG